MGKILIDGREQHLAVGEDSPVKLAFENAREQILAAGRIVVEVTVDSDVIVWNDGSPKWDQVFGPDVVLEIHTDTPCHVCTSLLERMEETLVALADLHRQAAELLRDGNDQEGIARTLEAIPYWQDITGAMSAVAALAGIDYSSDRWTELGGVVNPAIEQLAAQLGEFREAAEMRDLILLADLHEYELAPATQQWSTICKLTGDCVRQRFSTEGEDHS